MTQQDRDELKQDRLEEAKQDAYYENKMRIDYNYAKLALIDDNTELEDAVDTLYDIVVDIQKKFEEYGYQIDTKEILEDIL